MSPCASVAILFLATDSHRKTQTKTNLFLSHRHTWKNTDNQYKKLLFYLKVLCPCGSVYVRGHFIFLPQTHTEKHRQKLIVLFKIFSVCVSPCASVAILFLATESHRKTRTKANCFTGVSGWLQYIEAIYLIITDFYQVRALFRKTTENVMNSVC